MSKNYDGFNARDKRMLYSGMCTRSRKMDPGRHKRQPNSGSWGLFVVLVILLLLATCFPGVEFN